MACDNRQLSQAQRVEGYDAQRTGVQRAVRPYSGEPTVENLIDYLNRELYPAVKQTRDKVNDVYLQVADNAPSANPLGFYFSTETGAADPTTGYLRLDSATQNTATIVRVSQTNARLVDVAPWLDVMNGGATEPLGVLTITDAINPARFLRFDLDTMTDQGDYWDLGVSFIESSHDNPFVQDQALLLGFIPGLGATPVVIPPEAISPIPADTFLGNITTATAPPTAVPLADIDSASIVYDATSHRYERAALTGVAIAAQNGGLTVSTEPFVTYAAGTFLSNQERVATSSPSVTVSIATSGQIEWQRAELTGFTVAAANSNATTSAEPIVTFSASSNMSNERVLSNGTNTTVSTAVAGQISVGVDDLPLSALADQADDTFLANISGGAAPPTAVPLSTLAGDGLTGGADAVVNVGASTSIIVGANDVQRAALTGFAVAAANSNATTSAEPLVTFSASSNMSNERVATSSTSVTVSIATSGQIAWQRAALTGDVTATADSNATTIANDVVTNAKLANMAQATVKGRARGAGTGDPTDLSPFDLGAVLRIGGQVDETGAPGTYHNYAVPEGTKLLRINPGGAGDFILTGIAYGSSNTGGWIRLFKQSGGGVDRVVLKQEDAGSSSGNRFQTPNGEDLVLHFANEAVDLQYIGGRWQPIARLTGISDGDKGDITVSSGGTSWAIDNDVVTNAKLANMASPRLKGRTTSGTGDPEDLTLTNTDDIVWNTSTAGAIGLNFVDRAALSVMGRDGLTAGAPVDISAVGGSFTVLAEDSSVVDFIKIHAGHIEDGALDNSTLADMDQSRIKGRSEGAGTGAPEDLTPTQVVAIIDAEDAAWTGDHSWNSATFAVTTSGTTSIAAATFTATATNATVSATDDVFIGGNGAAISAGHALPGLVGVGDVLVNATSGIALRADATTPTTAAGAGEVTIEATGDVQIQADNGFGIFAGLTRANVQANEAVINAAQGIALTVNATTPTTNTNNDQITLTPITHVNIAGGLLLTGIETQTLSTGGTDTTITVGANTTVLRLNNTAGSTVQVVGFTGGVNGRVLLVLNVSTANGTAGSIRFQNQDTDATASDRFLFNVDRMTPSTGGDFEFDFKNPHVTLDRDMMALFWYDGTSSRWRVLEHARSDVPV